MSFYVPIVVSVIILIVSKFNSFTLGLCIVEAILAAIFCWPRFGSFPDRDARNVLAVFFILTLLQSIVIVMVFGSFIVTDLVG